MTVGIMGILASIVIVAVNPGKQLCEARNAKRNTYEREIKKCNFPNTKSVMGFPISGIPVGSENAAEMCKYNALDAGSCVVFDDLVDDNFIVSLPLDEKETNDDYSGYTVYQLATGQVVVAGKYNLAYGYGC